MKYILLIVLIVIAITQAGCSHFNVPNPAICLEITRDKGNCVKILSEEEFEVEDWANFVQTAVVMTKEDFQGVLNLIIDICEEQSCTHHKKIKRKVNFILDHIEKTGLKAKNQESYQNDSDRGRL